MMVCEDESDFLVAAGLVDRVVAEVGPSWLREQLEDNPEVLRLWQGDGTSSFFDIHCLAKTCKERGVRLPKGHFDKQSGGGGAQSARNAFALARHLEKRGADIAAVLFIWDMDQNAKERRPALERARKEAQEDDRYRSRFKVVLGCPNAMMEAWVLAGFDACDDNEHQQLNDERATLGFSPVTHSHQLDATSGKKGAAARQEEPLAKKSAKRVLAVLTGNDPDRILECWKETPLETLHDRGEHNGLRDYLEEIRKILVPLFQR